MMESPTAFEKILNLVQAGARQQDIWTCGPASMNLILTASGLDTVPEPSWKDQRFAKWVPVEQFPTRGIALHELQFLSEMLLKREFELQLKRAFPENLDQFVSNIEAASTSKDCFLVVNFRQDDFVAQEPGPQGNPHYSPIAGFDREKKRILVADVDPEVKEPYWVDIQDAFKSMAVENPAFGVPRGWLYVRRRSSR